MTTAQREVKEKKEVGELKRRLRERGLTYPDIARLAGVSWWMVYAVVNRRRTSARVSTAIQKLLGGVHASR